MRLSFSSTPRGVPSRALRNLGFHKSNIAVLPEKASGLQWRLSDFDGVEFDEATYELELRSAYERLIITKLAKRTNEFIECLRSAMGDCKDMSAKVLQTIFPFLSPDEFQAVSDLMREGHSAPVSKIVAVSPKIEPVLVENTVNAALKPYFDLLKKRMAKDCDYFAGFKMIRPDEADTAVGQAPEDPSGSEEENSAIVAQAEETIEEPGSEPEGTDEQHDGVLHWFFIPFLTNPALKISANIVAWEATSHCGRATYFFRINPEGLNRTGDVVASAVQRLNRALVMINFRREPIYLSDSSLDSQPRYRHYAVACRRIPVLRELRAAYIGRAIHTTAQAWQKQVEEILAKG